MSQCMNCGGHKYHLSDCPRPKTTGAADVDSALYVPPHRLAEYEPRIREFKAMVSKDPRWNDGHMCGICGYQPDGTLTDPMNSSVIRYWDPDDGWKIGHLCIGCYEERGRDIPHPSDYAYESTDAFPTVETDEDPLLAME